MPFKNPVTRVCEHCGDFYQAHSARARFCSSKCKMAFHRAEKAAQKPAKEKAVFGEHKPRRTCPHCGKGFTPKNSRAVFCSHSCGVVSNRIKQAETMRECMSELGIAEWDFWQMKDKVGWQAMYEFTESITKRKWRVDWERYSFIPMDMWEGWK